MGGLLDWLKGEKPGIPLAGEAPAASFLAPGYVPPASNSFRDMEYGIREKSPTWRPDDPRYRTKYKMGQSSQIPRGVVRCASLLGMIGIRGTSDVIHMELGRERVEQWMIRGWLTKDQPLAVQNKDMSFSLTWSYRPAQGEVSLHLGGVIMGAPRGYRNFQDLFSRNCLVFSDPVDWSRAHRGIAELGEFLDSPAV
jgi:hypothetical protein